MSNNTGFADIGPRQPKRAEISGATDPLEVVAAVGGKRIRVTGLFLQLSAAGTVGFDSGTTELGAWTVPAGGLLQVVLPYNPDGWLETASGEALNIDNDGTLTLSGFLTYVEI